MKLKKYKNELIAISVSVLIHIMLLSFIHLNDIVPEENKRTGMNISVSILNKTENEPTETPAAGVTEAHSPEPDEVKPDVQEVPVTEKPIADPEPEEPAPAEEQSINEQETELSQPGEFAKPGIGSNNETEEPAAQNTGTGSAEKSTDDYLPFYRVDIKPDFISRAELRYPPSARRNRIEGTVVIEADINDRGELVDSRVVKSAGFGFDEEALRMINESTFSPAVIEGRTTPVRMRFTIRFTLK